MTNIDLRCQDVADMLRDLPRECANLVMADPPWQYSDSPSGTHKGLARNEYDGLPIWDITKHLAAAARVAKEDAYLGCWCTFPKMTEWVYNSHPHLAAAGWHYITGGAWGKTGGLGVGHHFRGDAELFLLYKKGNAKPQHKSQSNLWLAPRTQHSEKPQSALRAIVEALCPRGGLVVDLYAGATASLARACRAAGRDYVGAEIDPERYALAMLRLSQQELLLDMIA